MLSISLFYPKIEDNFEVNLWGKLYLYYLSIVQLNEIMNVYKGFYMRGTKPIVTTQDGLKCRSIKVIQF